MVKTSAQPNKHIIHAYVYYTIIYNEQPVSQDRNNTRFSTTE